MTLLSIVETGQLGVFRPLITICAAPWRHQRSEEAPFPTHSTRGATGPKGPCRLVTTVVRQAQRRRVEATKVEDAMVGEVTDDLFIGITVTSDPSGTGERVVAYICDETGDGSYLTGPREDGRVTLTHGHVSTDRAERRRRDGRGDVRGTGAPTVHREHDGA